MATPESVDVSIEAEECIGCGACETEAPETFEMDDDAKAVLKDPPNDTPEIIINAAEACPTEAIVVKDKATGEQVVPAE